MPRPAADTIRRPARRDPEPRPVALFDQEDPTDLENRDDSLHYVYAAPGSAEMRRYLRHGFHSVEATEGGVVPIGGATVEPGAEITFEDQVLLACPKERWEEILEGGLTGNKGRRRADALESRILKPAGRQEVDGFRGRGMHLEAKGAER